MAARPLGMDIIIASIAGDVAGRESGERMRTRVEREGCCALDLSYCIRFDAMGLNGRIIIMDMAFYVYDKAACALRPASPDYLPYNTNQIENAYYGKERKKDGQTNDIFQ